MVSRPAWYVAGWGFDPRIRHVIGPVRCKNLLSTLEIVEYLCLSDETLKAVGPFYLVSMPGEVKYLTQGINV